MNETTEKNNKCVVCINLHYLLKSSGELTSKWQHGEPLPDFTWIFDYKDATDPFTQKKIKEILLDIYNNPSLGKPSFFTDKDIHLSTFKVRPVTHYVTAVY